MEKTGTIYIVDDDEPVRESLRWLFSSVQLAVETFASAPEFLDRRRLSRPACLLADLRMPRMSGLEMQRQLRDKGCDIPTIFLSGHGDIATAVRALQGGAMDFITKPYAEETLLEAVHQALERDRHNLLTDKQWQVHKARLAVLTERERAVLDHVVDGKSNKQIAAALSISPKTVEMHRANLMRRMHANSVAELVHAYFLATSQPSNHTGERQGSGTGRPE